ncbi:unnamed protein product [Clonostachys rosea]|uniref:NACHT domain-containing protein n=1 Tax=Bionectria ochroleuca TaxID=29856 RepID=A0ABY6V0U6_BIOOC|nr:unnamed protein product [Clonostachys rosea]
MFNLTNRFLSWGGNASLRESRNDESSTNDQPIQAGKDNKVVPKAACYRIQEIPIAVTKDELRRQLAQYPTVDEQDSSDLHLTLARSFEQYQTATFVSTTVPNNLKYPIDKEFIGITPLFEPDDAEIDIIAVHGLGSHAIGGFKSKGTSHVWLRDSLPHDIPNSRILLYGYDSSIMNKDHKISISGLGKTFLNSYKTFRKDTKTTQRPIIFLGHSLGGLLIKEALCIALDGGGDAQNRDFYKSSYGLVFFGVPNLGLKHENLRVITDKHLNKQLILDISVDTESEPTSYLQNLQHKFISCHRKQDPRMRIISFYEEKKTHTVAIDHTGKLGRTGEPCFMVTKESACRIGFEDDTHSQHPLPFDHSDLVKFARRGDASYRIVQNKLADLVQEGLDHVPRRFQSGVMLSEGQKRHWDDLNVPDYRAFYENKEKLASPVKGSLQWLVSKDCQGPQDQDSLQYDDFEAWRDSSEPSSLLILGPPGLGKSVLSNFVVNHIEQYVKNLRKNKVIFFFCNIKDDNARTASSVLRALIVQLCTDQRYFRKLPNRFQTKGDSKAFHSAAFGELWRTFDDLVQSGQHNRTFCVIDGLDVYETTGMEELVTKLQDMTRRFPIWLFFTSRPGGPVASFPPEAKRNLRQPDHDIEVYITEQMELLPKSFNKFHTDILQGISGRAGGTFLWIHIILKEIRKLNFPSKKSIRQVIEKTPQELDELYTTLFRAVSRGKHATAILAWVTFAKRPLSLKELEIAVAVMVTNSGGWMDCYEEKVSFDVDLIKERLGTLIDVIDGELFLIHQSLLDFLKSRSEIWYKGDLELKLLRPNLEIGRTCMRYLSFGATPLDDSSDEEEELSDILSKEQLTDSSFFDEEQATFLQYASTYWYEHIESINEVKGDINMLKSIIQGPIKSYWLLEHEEAVYFGSGLPTSIFDVCIKFDIVWLAGAVADPSIPELSQDLAENEVFQAAESSSKVFKHLIQHDLLSGFHTRPRVVVATAAKHDENLKLLLEKKGDEILITPEVVRAAARSSSENLKLLLERRGDEIQVTPEIMIAAVESCIWNGSLKLLLEKRGDEILITPEVVIAAVGGHPENVKLLLERRGDEILITPEIMMAAAARSSSENLKLLLKNRGDEIQITPEITMAAAARSSSKNLKLLLENRGDEIQITPEITMAAAARSSSENLKLLLEKRRHEVQITPEVLIVAARTLSMSMLRFLLEKKGDEIQSMLLANNLSHGKKLREMGRNEIVELCMIADEKRG